MEKEVSVKENEGGEGSKEVAAVPLKDVRAEGLGELAKLPDFLLLVILFSLEPKELLTLSLVSKSMYVLCGDEEMWKQRCHDHWEKGEIKFKGTWKMTYFLPRESPKRFTLADRVSVAGFHSDWYAQKWYLTFVSLKHFDNCPATIDRRSNLSVEEFEREYAEKSRPVIITDALKDWPATEKWKIENFKTNYGKDIFKCSSTGDNGKRLRFSANDFLDYCDQQNDLDPLYVFDPTFGKRQPELLKDYDIPPYFPVDYFGLLEGLPDKKRKVWRWLVFGPGRSMTKFHVDPCMTSAWNALLCGKKRWAFYPPSPAPPPGSFSKYDHDEKTWDHTIKEPMQWYCEVYPYLQPDMKPLEVVQNPGDLLYVPSGWWHSVLNLETNVAVTHNFVDRHNIMSVWRDLEKSAKTDDDYDDLLRIWKEKLEIDHPEIAKDLPDLGEKKEKKRKFITCPCLAHDDDDASNGDGDDETCCSQDDSPLPASSPSSSPGSSPASSPCSSPTPS